MFNQAIYSEEKIAQAVDCFSELLDRIMRTDDPEQIRVSQLVDAY